MLRLAEIIALHAIGFYLLFNGRVAAGLGNYTEKYLQWILHSRSSHYFLLKLHLFYIYQHFWDLCRADAAGWCTKAATTLWQVTKLFVYNHCMNLLPSNRSYINDLLLASHQTMNIQLTWTVLLLQIFYRQHQDRSCFTDSIIRCRMRHVRLMVEKSAQQAPCDAPKDWTWRRSEHTTPSSFYRKGQQDQ